MIKRLAREEDGQALIWGAGVIVLIVALFYGALDIGQLVLGKIEAQNAADAAALTAASIKASVHNTRSLAYRAASGQLQLSRLQMLRATEISLRELVPNPRGKADYQDALKLATMHRKKLEYLREGIVHFNEFATGTQAGPQAMRQAAEAIYKANLGSLAMEAPGNKDLVARSGGFPEIDGGMTNGNPMQAEALSDKGKAGKSAVVVEPQVSAFGGDFMGYGSRAALSAVSVAGQVDAHKQFGAKLDMVDDYGIEWYTTRLMPVGVGNLGKH